MAVGSGPTVQPVQHLMCYLESSFANDETASLASFKDVPFQEGSASFTLTRETHSPMSAVQHHHDWNEEILGKKAATLQFTVPIASSGTAANASTTAVQPIIGYLLKYVMGVENTLAQGATAVAGWTAETGDVTAGQGTRFSEGSALGWVNASSVLEMRPIQTISTDTLTLKLNLSGAPSNNDDLYNTVTYSLSQDPASSLQFVVQGLESTDEFVLLGGQLSSLTLSLPLDGTIPTAQFSFQFANWLHGDDAAGTFSDIAPVTYSAFSPITGHAGRFMVQTVGTANYTGSTVNVSECSFEPQLTYGPVTSPSGTNGVLRWRLMRNQGPSVQGSFTTYFEDTTRWTGRDNKTDYLILYQIGTEAGKSVLFEVSTAQFTDVQRVDAGGIAGEQVTWKGRLESDITTPSGDQEWSPFRIHFG